ncbi:Hint domain-containing protein [Phaeobacter porticola]|uniref:Hint domain protein n=1 Tax=Phaeobacter porticola TaxID=1844006 RepID=A0A1L3I2Z9_9RHOB|nr:Hint domain-containing protein [Phaeobacter porticola]APG46481.1 Hint domain protein [Phaeobacter porticola]
MLLDHSTSFADCQPVGLLMDFPASLAAISAASRARPRPRTGGLLPHMMVETDRGFVQARHVKPGDMVYTLDGGAQEVTAVKHAVPRLTSLVHVPAGALGNDDALLLPADQKVGLELAAVERLFDVPTAMTKVVSLIGHKGISAAMPEKMARIYLSFSEEEMIWAECGMLVHVAGAAANDSAFRDLSLAETRQILASEDGRALTDAGKAEDDQSVEDNVDVISAFDMLRGLLAA